MANAKLVLPVSQSPILSIVFGTLNRLEFVRRALASIPGACGDLPYEIIVVDGGSTDGTLEMLKATNSTQAAEIHVIEQHERLGAVAAFNAGFAAAKGAFVANFNDDAEYVGAPLANAVLELQAMPSLGQIAIPFWTCKVHSADELEATPEATCARHGVIIAPQANTVRTFKFGEIVYANFGVTRRRLGAQVGWWGQYFQYAGDTELSCKIVEAGFGVKALDPALGSLIHYELQDGTRRPNIEQPMFDAKWRGHKYGGRRQQAESSQTSSVVRNPDIPPAPSHMSKPVLVEYLGKRHGKMTWQREGSRYKYVVGAQCPKFWADASDVEWLCTRMEKGRTLFQKAN